MRRSDACLSFFTIFSSDPRVQHTETLLKNVIINHLKLDEKLMLAAYFKARVSFFHLRAKVTSITYFS